MKKPENIHCPVEIRNEKILNRSEERYRYDILLGNWNSEA
jgi:hypothetical protein